MNPVELALLQSRAQAICDEMGVILRRTAFSPNIKDRLDFSCALFDPRGELFAQAAHIPVHLGSMAFAMRDVVASVDWRDGDVMVFNDPFLGGTHLPDVTVVRPVILDGALLGFAAARAHHADIGADEPGSMPLARRLDEEGIVIPPLLLLRDGVPTAAAAELLGRLAGTPAAAVERDLAAWQGVPALADFFAQTSAAGAGARRLAELAKELDPGRFLAGCAALNDYAERLAADALAAIPPGTWHARDRLDDDGLGQDDIHLEVNLRVRPGHIEVDFTGTSPQVDGNLNCPLSVAAAATYYVMRCLMPPHTPGAAGAFRSIEVTAPPGCLLNARPPAAVAAGNVETSMRVVDLLLRALAPALPDRIPACSQGTMNNVAMGWRGTDGRWDYYETIGGGSGAGPLGPGASGIHTHMTNTLNTPVESLEAHYPLRVQRYALRRYSGGAGRHRGGDGVVREYLFLGPARCTLLTERRRFGPPGLAGGADGVAGSNRLNGEILPGKCVIDAVAGDLLTLETPGGGGWGAA